MGGGGGYIILEGRFNGGFFALRGWGAYIILVGLIFGILQYAGFILVECLIFTNVFTSTTHCNILKKTVN